MTFEQYRHLAAIICYSGLLKGPEHASGVIESRTCRGGCIFGVETEKRVSNSRQVSENKHLKIRSSVFGASERMVFVP